MAKHEINDALPPIALVVDDEPLILMDTADIISDEGFTVIEATTAERAFELLTENASLQLLFTDVQTPGTMNGIDLAWEVSKRWPHIRVVVASGAVKPEPGALPEAAIFIAKPISADLVHDVLVEHRLKHEES